MAAEHRSNHPDLRPFPGANAIMQAHHMLMSRRPSYATLSWDNQVKESAAYVRRIDPDNPYLMSANKKNELKDPPLHPNGPTPPANDDRPPPPAEAEEEDDDEQRMSAEDMGKLAELSVALQAAAKAGDLAKVRSCLQEIARITGDTQQVPVGSHAERMSAVAAYAGRNEIERSMTFLLTSPKAPPGFDMVPPNRRPLAAARWFRSGQSWEDCL